MTERHGEPGGAPLISHLRGVVLRQVARDLMPVQQPQPTALEGLCLLQHPLDPELLELEIAYEALAIAGHKGRGASGQHPNNGVVVVALQDRQLCARAHLAHAPERRPNRANVFPVPEPEQAAPSPEQAAPRSSTDLRVLFIDCLPTRYDGPVPEPLTAYVDAMAHKVAEAGGVDDLRFAGPDSPLGFGKWKGALAIAVRDELPPPGAYLALGLAHSELLQVVTEALEPACDVVVRGVK